MAKNGDVVALGELPGELIDVANHWRASGLMVQARKDDAGEWRVAWTDTRRGVFPDDVDVWVGWSRVVWPNLRYKEWLR